MRKTTKFLTLVLAVIMTISMFATGASAAFEDVDYATAEGDAVNLLVSLGVTKGTTETKFGTAENVTRQQMAAFIYRLMKAGKSVEGGTNNTTFTDLTDSTFFYMVSWANQTGVIKGVSETKFNPTGNITLQDAYTMVVRALGYEKDGALSYPFGYIEVAEEIGLDEDLPSTLGYTDILTRGNVAVILANAFYADMATYEIAYESLGYEVIGSDGKSYADGVGMPEGVDIKAAYSKGQRPYNKYDTVASKVFGVEKVVQYVIATPSFSFDGAELEEADVEMIMFSTDVDGKLAFDPETEDLSVDDYALTTVEFAELGLEGKADDYFLAGIELYIKKDGSDKEILGATSLLNKKTVKGDKIEIGTLSGTADSKYYTNAEALVAEYDEDFDEDPDAASDYKRMNGLLTIDGVKTYIFDAPYSYSKPEKIADINAENAEFITLGAYDGEYEDEEEPVEVKFNYVYDSIAFAEDYEEELGNIEALEALYLAYFGGFYEMDVYDIDNDGRYEFINYKPYAVVEIDDAEDEALVDNQTEPVVYIDRTIVVGEEVADKDIVIAVVAPWANFIDVKAVLEPTEARVTGLATKYAKFDSGEKHEFAYADLVLANAAAELANPDNFTIDTEGEFYFYEGKLVYADELATNVNFNEDWVIVLDAETTETAVMNGNRIETSDYVQIYHDGEIKDVKAKKITEDMLEKARWEDYAITFNGTDFDFTAYVDQLATAKTDAKGAYYFDVLDLSAHADADVLTYDEDDDEYEENAVYAYTAEDITFVKKSGYNYVISDKGEASFTQVAIKDYTQIIIKTWDDDEQEVVFEVYGYDNLPNFDEDFTFDTATVLVANNKNTNRTENLVVLYATTTVETEASAGEIVDYRVVLSYESEMDEESETVYTVKTFDPATGDAESLEAVEGNVDFFKKGVILAKTSEGYLADDASFGNIYAAGDVDLDTVDEEDKYGKLGYVEIANYDEDSKTIELAGDDNTYTVTKDTVFLEYDNSDASVKAATDAMLTSTGSKYTIDQTKGGKLCAFISAVEDEDADDEGYYFVRFVVVVHK